MTVSRARLQLCLRAAFLVAATATLIVALAPVSGPSAGNADKFHHFLAFYVLTLVGAAAFPGPRSLPWLTLGMLLYGGLVEVLQAVMPYDRSPDMKDWLADAIGVAAVAIPLMLGAWRQRSAGSLQ